MSQQYARVRRSYLEQHLLPEFKDRPLTSLKPADFRDYKMRLLAAGNLSPATINRILGTVRVMFGYAVRMGELETNPISPVTELKETPRVRGILSIEELRKLFAPDALMTVWHNDLRHYTMNLLAASGGLRLGEVQALQVRHVHPDHVEVRHSWDDKFGRSEPKWGSARIVPIPSRTAESLDELLALNRWGSPLPDDVVFWGRDRETPHTKTAILSAFKTAVCKIGITEEQRRARTLVFHSYRHLFNTLVRGQVPDEQLRRVTGHKGIAMTDTYDHAGTEHLHDVLAVQEKLFAK
jgi:integrase